MRKFVGLALALVVSVSAHAQTALESAKQQFGSEQLQKAAPLSEPVGPRAIFMPAAKYPPVAARKGISGTTVMLVSIGADGLVTDVQIDTSSGNDDLDRSARETALRWRFHPARGTDNLPTTSKIKVPMNFGL